MMDDGGDYELGSWIQNPVASFGCVVDALFIRASNFYFNNGYLWWLWR